MIRLAELLIACVVLYCVGNRFGTSRKGLALAATLYLAHLVLFFGVLR